MRTAELTLGKGRNSDGDVSCGADSGPREPWAAEVVEPALLGLRELTLDVLRSRSARDLPAAADGLMALEPTLELAREVDRDPGREEEASSLNAKKVLVGVGWDESSASSSSPERSKGSGTAAGETSRAARSGGGEPTP